MSLSMSLLQNVDPKHLRLKPFPHVVIKNALNFELYETLSKNFPSTNQIIRGREVIQNSRYDLDARYLIRDAGVHGVWREFCVYNTSNCFWREIVDIFEKPIEESYGGKLFQDTRAETLYDLKTGVRGIENDVSVVLDCKPGINTPVTRISRVRGPHVDNPVEIIGGLLYMKEPGDDSVGGDLLIYEPKKTVEFYGKAEIRDNTVREVSKVRYAANTLIVFMNSVQSIHGVSVKEITPNRRRLINFCAESPRSLFALERG